MLSAVSDGWAMTSGLMSAAWVQATAALLMLLLLVSMVRHGLLRSRASTTRSESDSPERPLVDKEQDLRAMFDQSCAAVMLLDRASRAPIYANQTALAAFGAHSPEQLAGRIMGCADAWPDEPFSLSDFERRLDQVRASGNQPFEWLALPAGGIPTWLEVSLSLVQYGGKAALMFTGLNITPLKNAERADRLRQKAMASMARDSVLSVTLDQLAAIVEIAIPGAHCAIMVHDDETDMLRLGGGKSVPPEFREGLGLVPVEFGAAGCGTAAYIQGSVVSHDIRADQRWERFRRCAELAGFRACWSEPMFGSGNVLLGTFDVYHTAPWTPGNEDIDRLTGPLHLAGLTIERHRGKIALDNMVMSEQMVRRISTDLLTVDPHETDQAISRTCSELGEHFQAQRVVLCQLDTAGENLHLTHEWADSTEQLLAQQAVEHFPLSETALQALFGDQSKLVVSGKGERPSSSDGVSELLPLDGNQSLLLAAVSRQGRIAGFLGVVRSSTTTAWTSRRIQTVELMASLLSSAITRKDLVNSLTFQAVRDQLTGLYNRHKLEEILSQEVARCLRYSSVFSVIIFDLDHFKSVNDRFGHNGGDAVLSSIARIVEANVRETEIAGRWGGEEFLMVLPETTLDSALQLAERLRSNVEAHQFPIPQQVTVSIGVASFASGDTPKKIVQRADAALYAAKEAGRNRVMSSL
ncbi:MULTISPECIES: diguanylate cyclase [Pseudomonas]|uniref:sensor domain-containing diguanylate cyclase n=1 Tax=Pseudomonas TaxID=286 RepID=UPI00123B6D30|nr:MULTISPECIES: diguanylate cyclase [Pseudomonas]QIB52916.1 diguanylate cyclase [Pseudomonas sp. OIL-1]